jgi:hypothetical protein
MNEAVEAIVVEVIEGYRAGWKLGGKGGREEAGKLGRKQWEELAAL